MQVYEPRLTVVVPVYNEARQLKDVVDQLMLSPCPIPRDWIFVDDHSTDSSVEILTQLQSKYGFQLIKQPKNSGKGTAVRVGIKAAKSEFLMIQDADFEYDPNDIPSLLVPLLSDHADVVYGSRFKKNGIQVHRTYHYFVNRFLTLMSNLLSGVYLTDMETCYKIFRSDFVKSMRLESARFGIEVEMTAYIGKTSARVYELPINYYPRTQLQGKKINWKDGVAALWHLVRFNLLVSREQAFDHLPERYHPDRSGPSRRPPPPDTL